MQATRRTRAKTAVKIMVTATSTSYPARRKLELSFEYQIRGVSLVGVDLLPAFVVAEAVEEFTTRLHVV